MIKDLYKPFIENNISPHFCDWGIETCATNAARSNDLEETNCAIFATYIRSRIQSAIWDIVHSLAVDGYIDIDITKSFAYPVHFNCIHPAVQSLATYFSCLERVCDFDDALLKWPEMISQHFDYFINEVMVWLSVVVIRGMTAPPIEILTYILRSEWLGGMNEEVFEMVREREASKMTEESIPDIDKVGSDMDLFAFLLPRRPIAGADAGTLGKIELLRRLNAQFSEKFNTLEYFTKEYFAIGWGDEVVSLLKEDTSVLELANQRPEGLMRLENDKNDTTVYGGEGYD
ncbi:hypothetical protein TWF281_000778 [Arthrobotrys megalospora]